MSQSNANSNWKDFFGTMSLEVKTSSKTQKPYGVITVACNQDAEDQSKRFTRKATIFDEGILAAAKAAGDGTKVWFAGPTNKFTGKKPDGTEYNGEGHTVLHFKVEGGETVSAAKKAKEEVAPEPQDLTVLKGIGAGVAEKMNAAGIVSYSQIAAMSEEDFVALEATIGGVKGAYKRYDWAGQAAQLVSSTNADKVANMTEEQVEEALPF